MVNRNLKRQKAINYLIKHPYASARKVADHSGLTIGTVYKIIKQRQTPVEVLKANWKRVVEPDEAQWKVMAVEAVAKATAEPPGAKMLKEAVEVLRQRGETYGDAAAHWRDVAGVWTSISGTHINADTAVKMMIALKLLRLKASPNHMDSITDIAGYAAVLANVVSE
jgi:hypothetical protein